MWLMDFPGCTSGKKKKKKNPPANARDARDMGLILGQEDDVEKEIATYFSILAWEIPWTEKTGRLQSMGSQGVEHD